MTRIELVTSSLPRKRSTPELHRLLLAGLTPDSIKNQIKTQKSCLLFADETPVNNNILTKLQGWKLSGRPGSNWRHSAWKADALPTELLPLLKRNTMISQAFNFKKSQSQYGYSSDCRHLRVKKVCGESRIRTCEDVVSRFTVCPRWPLEYLPIILKN